MNVIDYEYEDIELGQIVTKYNHGGPFFRIETTAIGYGGINFNYAWFNSMLVKRYSIDSIDINSDGVNDGFSDGWQLDGMGDSGIFKFEARSFEQGPTMSVQLKVR